MKKLRLSDLIKGTFWSMFDRDELPMFRPGPCIPAPKSPSGARAIQRSAHKRRNQQRQRAHIKRSRT